jgi:serine/threonine-protein kinase
MADIHKALDSGGQVVVRQLKRDLRFNRKMRQRFKGGIAVRRQCGEHPNIVQYHGEGGTWFTCPYEVIEFVGGRNLKLRIAKQDRVVLEDRLGVLRQCAAALAHVHQTGFLHLDIKPENYFVNVAGDDVVVKLSDFDLCLPVSTTRAPNKYGGSPMYAAPEFLKDQRISVATDIFAFGVMAYNLLTLQMPFVGSVASLMEGGRKAYEIVFPETVQVPADVQEIVLRCLARSPRDRYGTATALFSVLDQCRRRHRRNGVRI